MNKIFPKICLKFYFNVTKQMNGNKYYDTTSCIPYNAYPYSYVITMLRILHDLSPITEENVKRYYWFYYIKF